MSGAGKPLFYGRQHGRKWLELRANKCLDALGEAYLRDAPPDEVARLQSAFERAYRWASYIRRDPKG